MKKQALLSLFLITSLFTPILAQRPMPTPQGQEDVVRITTNLVQADVIVLDKEGRQVTNLGAEDFEVLEDGRRQKITDFSYISAIEADASRSASASGPASSVNSTSSGSPATLSRRVIAFVIDDLGLSFQSIGYVRDALKRFVDEQMQPNDLVAILRTSGNIGTLQQVTSDKRQLHAAIDRIRWFSAGRKGLDPYEDIKSGLDAPENR